MIFFNAKGATAAADLVRPSTATRKQAASTPFPMRTAGITTASQGRHLHGRGADSYEQATAFAVSLTVTTTAHGTQSSRHIGCTKTGE